MKLLERARRINAMLQTTTGKSVDFNEMSATMRDVIEANTFVVSRRGSCSASPSTRKLKTSA